MSWVLKFLVAILFPLCTCLFFEHEISYDNILLTHLTITVPGASFRAPWRRLGVPNWRRETAAMDPWISCLAPLPSSELPRLRDLASFTSISGGRRKPFRSCLWKTWRGTVVIFLRPSVGFLSHRGYQMIPKSFNIIENGSCLNGGTNGLGYTGTPNFKRHIIQTACFFDPARELVLEQIHHFRKKVLLSVAWLDKIRWSTTTQESGHFCIEPFLKKKAILGPSTVSLCTQIKAQLPTYPFWNFLGSHFLGDRWPWQREVLKRNSAELRAYHEEHPDGLPTIFSSWAMVINQHDIMTSFQARYPLVN